GVVAGSAGGRDVQDPGIAYPSTWDPQAAIFAMLGNGLATGNRAHAKTTRERRGVGPAAAPKRKQGPLQRTLLCTGPDAGNPQGHLRSLRADLRSGQGFAERCAA